METIAPPRGPHTLWKVSTASATLFDPARCSEFRIGARRYDPETATVTLSYALDEIAFDEVVVLPAGAPQPTGERKEALESVLALLHLVAGVSYFKAGVPPRVEVEAPLAPAVASLVEDVYRLGLGEFAYRNGLDRAVRISVPRLEPDDGRPAPPTVHQNGGSLVSLGGGKDSAVAFELARTVAPVTLFSVGSHPPIREAARISGLPHLVATRRISPRLLELNREGALNGHVPVTAIVSLIALATAVLHGHEQVVMANERSASQGTLHWDGIEVNHQWSKGYEFELSLRRALAQVVRGIDYFSLLRPAGELSIARAFAQMRVYHHAFMSCNSVFRLTQPAVSKWCCDCPKCRFVYLVMAPFLAPAELVAIFGADLLDDPAQISGFMALCGFQVDKPFECVGEREESVAAFRLLAESSAWGEHRVVRYARDTMLAVAGGEAGEPEKLLQLNTVDHNVPEPFLNAVLAHLRT
jgi:UDP-N-acetyl-alpha-D-muramoyl-L-alanyl-L-glutamate epimerase